MKVIQKEYGTSIDILFNLDPYTARPIMVSDTGVTAVDGKKIVKAGSLLDADGEIANDDTVRYVLLKDVDVTHGDAPGAGVYRGTINLDKVESNTGVTISETAQKALKGVIFMSDEDCDYVTNISDPEAAIDTLEDKVEALEETIGDEDGGLVKDLADLDAIVTAEDTGLVDIVANHETRIVTLETTEE